MSVNLTIAGTSYTYPTEGETGWGQQATAWATAVSTQLLQRSGGNFSLTNDVNFGANFATIQTYLKSRSSNISATGFVRLARTDAIGWRNAANSADLLLTVDGSNRLTFNGVIIPTAAGGVLDPANGGTGISSYAVGDMLYATGSTTLAKLNIATANYVLVSNGTAPTYQLIVNANVDPAAAIAYSKLNLSASIVNADVATAAAIVRSKLASGTAYRILANNASGVMSENAALTANRVVIVDANGQLADEANLAISRGGTNAGTATAAFNNLSPTTTRGDLITRDATNNVRLAIGAAGTTLRSDGTDASWGAFAPMQREVFTSSGTFTVPALVTAVKVTVVGGGGGGGGVQATTAGNSASSGGGGGGGTAIKWVTGLTPGSTVSVTVGVGGSGGSAGANNGSPGGDSSFGVHCTGGGGLGGGGGAATSGSGLSSAGAGGGGTNGDLNFSGQGGGYGNVIAGNRVLSGFGGSSYLGGGGRVGIALTQGYGAGGGGETSPASTAAAAGFAGRPGVVIVEWIAV